MARKNSHGKFILSAGEIGTYAVCPESWRLRMVERVKISKSDRSVLGEELHQQWTMQNQEAIFFAKGVRVLIMLVAVAILLSLLIFHSG